MILLDELTDKVIGSAIRVHKELGPGLLESAYQECLFYILKKEGLSVEKKNPFPLNSKRLNLIVVTELTF